MLYDFEEDDLKIFDQYMLGPSLLVAPALYEGQDKRRVVLPVGKWMEVSTGNVLDGDRTIEVDCPIDSIGLFVLLQSEYENDLRTVFGV